MKIPHSSSRLTFENEPGSFASEHGGEVLSWEMTTAKGGKMTFLLGAIKQGMHFNKVCSTRWTESIEDATVGEMSSHKT